jgi:hypothetical protein
MALEGSACVQALEVEGSRPMALEGSARMQARGVASNGIGSGMCVRKS